MCRLVLRRRDELGNIEVVKIASDAQVRIARLLLEHGPSSAADLATQLALTQTAVRRQLDALTASGWATSHERAPFGPLPQDPRGRGRPAKIFTLTSAGRNHFEERYDSLAVDALREIRQLGGTEAVRSFAKARMRKLWPTAKSVRDLVEGLSALGYAAEARPAMVAGGEQLCQRNCPISHVAAEFPEFCEVETELISEALGAHVTRLSTISNGSDICTTQIHARRVS